MNEPLLRISELIQKKLQGQIDAAEQRELDVWISDKPENYSLVKQLESETWLAEGLEKFRSYDETSSRARLVDALTDGDGSAQNRDAHRFRKIWFRWTAAACITVLLGLTTWLFFNNRNGRMFVDEGGKGVLANVNEIAPGSNKATLTLADGTKINLDSANKGIMAMQPGSSIAKTDSGLLTYRAVDESTGKPKNPFDKKLTASVLNTLTTPRGGKYELMLPDGTKVWLNAASSITYPTAFTGKERRVTITGEAYFEVVHNNRQPFTVSVNGTDVHDIGTHFNINAYPDELSMNTTLLEGSVQVAGKILRPGQQSQIAGNIHNIINADLDYTMAWRNDKLQLSHGDVKKLFREISRWYDVDVEYSGTVPEGQFSASIKRNLPLSNLLSVFSAYGIQTKVENKKIIVQ